MFHGHGGGGHGHGSSSAVVAINNDAQDELEVAVSRRDSIQSNALARAAAILDVIIVVALWLAAGAGHPVSAKQYFYDSVVTYSFATSLFDMALIAFLRGIIVDTLQSRVALLTSRGRLALLWATVLSSSLFGIIKTSMLAWSDPASLPAGTTFSILIVTFFLVFSLIEAIQASRARATANQLQYYEALVESTLSRKEADAGGVDGGINSRHRNRPNVSIGRLFQLVIPEIGILSFAMIGLFINTLSGLAMPFVFGQVVDALVGDGDQMAQLNQSVAVLLIIFAIGAIAGFIRSWLFTLAGHRVVKRLRTRVFEAIIEQEIAFFDRARTGELTSRLASDTQVVQNAVTVNISMLIRYTIQIIGSIIILLVLSWQLSLVMFSVVPLVAIAAVIYGRYLQKLQKRFQDELAGATTVAEEVISNMRTVRSFSNEPKSRDQYAGAVQKAYGVGRNIAMAGGIFQGGMSFVPQAAIALVLWFGGVQVIEGKLTTGFLTSFLLYTLSMAMAFAFMSALYGDFMAAVGASQRLFDIMDRVPEIPTEGGQILNINDAGEGSLEGRIEFDNVSFTYPSRPDVAVLSEVSLSLAPGHVLALVGPSGGGKSTIVSLLERFYDVTNGRILIDGVDLKSLDPRWYRSQVGLVSQEPVLFAGTIRDNITFGMRRTVTDDEVVAAATAANAHAFIDAFPDKYNTYVGERGVRLSGGQKQRVAIARALLLNPRILLLDEATSALDAQSEHLVQEAIDRAMRDRTVLVIAHRLSTVKAADCIAVLSGGKIVEKGTHNELIELGGMYKELVERQLQSTTSPPLNAEDNQAENQADQQ